VDCLRDYIGVNWCGATTTPPSGLYINQLPGISFNQMMSLSNSEQKTFAAVWDDVQTRAIARFKTDFVQKANLKYKVESITDSITIFPVITTQPAAPQIVVGNNLGLEFDLECFNDIDFYYRKSVMQDFYIQSVLLYATDIDLVVPPAGCPPQNEITLQVYVDDDYAVVYEQVVVLAEGWNRFEINFGILQQLAEANSIYADRVFTKMGVRFINNHLEFNTLEFDLMPIIDRCCCCNAAITGTRNSADIGTLSHGVGIVMGARCTWDRFVCANKDKVKTALWYLLGIELMNEQLFSERLNEFTTINLKKAQELKSMYEVHYMGGTFNDIQYDGALSQVIANVTLSASDCCLECNEQLQIKEVCL